MAYFPPFSTISVTRHEIDADLAQLTSSLRFEGKDVSEMMISMTEVEELLKLRQQSLDQNQQSLKSRVGFTFGHNVCWLFACFVPC